MEFKDSIAQIFNVGKIENSLIIAILKGHPILNEWYAKSLAGRDNLTLEQHTMFVMENFEKYFVRNTLLFSSNYFKFFLALHDIGKPKAILMGDSERQHEFSVEIIDSVFGTEYSEDFFKRIKVFIDVDPIGKFG